MMFAFTFVFSALLFGIVQCSDDTGKIERVQYQAQPFHWFTVSGLHIPLLEPAKYFPGISEAKAKHLEVLKLAEENAKKAAEAKTSAFPAEYEIIKVPSSSLIIQPLPLLRYPYGISYGELKTPQIIKPDFTPPLYLIVGTLEQARNLTPATANNKEESSGDKISKS